MNPVTDTRRRDAKRFGVFVSHITEEAHLARKIFQVLELVDERDCRSLVEHVGAVLKLTAAEGYDYKGMAQTLFELPERGADIGVVLTHGQDGWARQTYTLFNLPGALPERL